MHTAYVKHLAYKQIKICIEISFHLSTEISPTCGNLDN